MDNRSRLTDLLNFVNEEKVLGRAFETDEINDLADFLLANGVKIQDWISVEEGLPEYYTDVAVIVRNGDASWYMVAYLAVGGIWALEGGRRIIGVVTNWMPLPDRRKRSPHDPLHRRHA